MSRTIHGRVVLALLTAFLFTTTAHPGLRIATAQEVAAITIGTTDLARTIDPANAIDFPSWELLYHLATGLTRQVPGSLDYELALASDHTVSEDGLRHTFTIRPDVTFNDGTPITAETFAHSIQRVIDLGRDGAEFVSRFVVAVRATKGNALQFDLAFPLPDFEALVGLPPFFPQHPDVFPVDDLLDRNVAETFIGNGPYRLESYTPSQIVLVADPGYPGEPPATGRIVLRRYALPIDLRRAVETGEVDIAWRALAQPDLAAVQNLSGITIQSQPNLQVYYLLLNHRLVSANTSQAAFDDPAVREAFTLLMDRAEAARVGFDDTLTALDSLIPPQFGLTPVPFPAYDLARAEEVLQAAGYRERRRTVQMPLYISSSTYGDLMTRGAQELRRGLEQTKLVDITTIQDDQASTFSRVVYRGEYMNALIGWYPLYASPAGYLLPLVHSAGSIPANAGYARLELDDLLRQVSLNADPAEQDALYAAIQDSLRANFDLIPLFQGQDTIVYQTAVSGVQVEANGWLRYTALTR